MVQQRSLKTEMRFLLFTRFYQRLGGRARFLLPLRGRRRGLLGRAGSLLGGRFRSFHQRDLLFNRRGRQRGPARLYRGVGGRRRGPAETASDLVECSPLGLRNPEVGEDEEDDEEDHEYDEDVGPAQFLGFTKKKFTIIQDIFIMEINENIIVK